MNNGIIQLENVIAEKISKEKDGRKLITLFNLCQEYRIGDELDLENKFTTAAMNHVAEVAKSKNIMRPSWVYTAIRNIIYSVEIYLSESGNMKYLQAASIILTGNAYQLISQAERWFISQIFHLQKMLRKVKAIIPNGSYAYRTTSKLINELYSSSEKFEKLPCSDEYLADYQVASFYTSCILSSESFNGYYALERIVYEIYRQLKILGNFDPLDIDSIVRKYIRSVHMDIFEGNLFELVMNNYLFATMYSDQPRKLIITQPEAKLILMEIVMGTISAEELVNQAILDLGYTEKHYEINCLRSYEQHLAGRINVSKKLNVIGELFVVEPSRVKNGSKGQ